MCKETFTLVYTRGVRKGKFILTDSDGTTEESEVEFKFNVAFDDGASLSVESARYAFRRRTGARAK